DRVHRPIDTGALDRPGVARGQDTRQGRRDVEGDGTDANLGDGECRQRTRDASYHIVLRADVKNVAVLNVGGCPVRDRGVREQTGDWYGDIAHGEAVGHGCRRVGLEPELVAHHLVVQPLFEGGAVLPDLVLQLRDRVVHLVERESVPRLRGDPIVVVVPEITPEREQPVVFLAKQRRVG